MEGSGPAGDCTGQGALCKAITVRVPNGSVVCAPGATVACPYGGPAGTQGVGICRAGANTCKVDGTGWSGCVGEVLPQQETCATPVDDNCDGQVNEIGAVACGCVAGETVSCYGGPASTQGVGVCRAGTRTCDSTVGGFGPCVGEIRPGSERCDTPEDDDCNGTAVCQGGGLWSHRFGGAGEERVTDVAAGGPEFITLVGTFTGAVDFGGGPLTAGSSIDTFLVGMDSQGNHRWSRQFSLNAPPDSTHVAMGLAGEAVVAGTFAGAVDFGGGPLTSVGAQDVFVTGRDPQGNHRWSQRFGDAASESIQDVVVDPQGNTLVVGFFGGTVDFGGGPLTAVSSQDIFLVKLAPMGQHLWSRSFRNQGPPLDQRMSLAVDGAGTLLLTGLFAGGVDLGGGMLSQPFGVFAARFRTADGSHIWSRSFFNGTSGGGPRQRVSAAFDRRGGDILVALPLVSELALGDTVHRTVGGSDIVIARLDGTGNPLWSHRFGDGGFQAPTGLVVDSQGRIVVTGEFQGVLDFGASPLISAGGLDVFVVQLDETGITRWNRSFGDSTSQFLPSLAMDRLDHSVVAGGFQGTVDFGNGPLTSAGGADAFVIRLGP